MKMKYKHSLTWNMARNTQKTWKMRNAHCMTWNMMRNTEKVGKTQTHTVVQKYVEKTEKHEKREMYTGICREK